MFRNLRKLHLVQRFIIFIHLLYSTTRNYCVSIQNISLISLVSPQIQSNTLISIIYNVDNNDFYSLKLGSVAIKSENTLINTLMYVCVIHWVGCWRVQLPCRPVFSFYHRVHVDTSLLVSSLVCFLNWKDSQRFLANGPDGRVQKDRVCPCLCVCVFLKGLRLPSNAEKSLDVSCPQLFFARLSIRGFLFL